MVNLIHMLQLTYYHLIPAHNLSFSYLNYMLQASGLVSHTYMHCGHIFSNSSYFKKALFTEEETMLYAFLGHFFKFTLKKHFFYPD